MAQNDRDTDAEQRYEIRVAGHLAPRWSAWFDGMTIDAEADGTTVMRGLVADQSALHGLLQKLRDVGIPLISLNQLQPQPSHTPITSSQPLTQPQGELT